MHNNVGFLPGDFNVPLGVFYRGWFKNIPNKANHIFTIFDIDSFYPSVTEKLLTNVINYAKQYVIKKLSNCYQNELESGRFSRCDIRPFQRIIFPPYKKTGNQPLYTNTQSSHSLMIIKHLPAAISRRISDISCNQEIFDQAKPDYDKALRDSRYTEELLYVKTSDNEDLDKSKKKKRKRNIILFNPPYSKNVQTNVGKFFYDLSRSMFQ